MDERLRVRTNEVLKRSVYMDLYTAVYIAEVELAQEDGAKLFDEDGEWIEVSPEDLED